MFRNIAVHYCGQRADLADATESAQTRRLTRSKYSLRMLLSMPTALDGHFRGREGRGREIEAEQLPLSRRSQASS